MNQTIETTETITVDRMLRRHDRGQRPTQRPRHPVTRPVGPCRLASVLVDQHRGLPLFSGLDDVHGDLLPAEQALWGVGLQGINGHGRLYSRAGLYACDAHEQGRWKLILHADYDRNGQPVLRPGKSVPPSRLAALGWVAAALFAAPSHAPAGPYDVANDVATLYRRRPIPRAEFAAERTDAAAAALFARWCRPVFTPGAIPAGLDFRVPHTVPLLTPDQLSADVPVHVLPVAVHPLTPAAVRGHAVGRYTLALARATGDGYAGLKRAFIQQFDVADRLIASGNRHALVHQRTAALSMIRANSLAYLTTVGITESHAAAPLDALAGALKLLEWFYRPESRTPDGRVLMYAPAAVSADKRVELHARLFRRPAARGVGGAPVELVDGFLSDGSFPDDGSAFESLGRL